MTFPQRLSYFGGGLFLGIIFLFFFLSGKKTSCDYGPNARVLKNIRLKERFVSAEALQQLKNVGLDTSSITTALAKADIDFGKSNTKLDSCKVYIVNSMIETQELTLTIENCHKKATIQKINISKIIE